MKVSSKRLPRGQAELTVELTPDEYQPFLQRAAAVISEQFTVPGFRPGKAPYAVVVEKIGEAKLWEEALEPAVKKTFPRALSDAGVVSVGAPSIAVRTLAPGNPVSYRATVSLLPEVQLADLTSIRVTRQKPSVSDADVAGTIEDLRKLRRAEALISRPAHPNDKVEIKLGTFLDNVAVDAGQAERLPLVLGEGKFLPGFEEHVVGLSADQEKTFSLKLPADYHNRTVAGKTVEFRVKVTAVYELSLPELNDEFAKSLGRFASLDDLRAKLKTSLLQEKTKREEDRLENGILDEISGKSIFSDIPDLLVTTETKNMLAELEQQIGQRSISFDDYLAHLKKTRAQLLLDFTPQAVKRIKGALITREIARRQNFAVSPGEIDAAIEREFSAYGAEPEVAEKIKLPAFRARVSNILASRKVMEYLKKLIANSLRL